MDSKALRTTHWDLRWSLEGGGISWEQAKQGGLEGNLGALIEAKIADRSGGLLALEHALRLLEKISREGAFSKVVDADGVAPSLEAARDRGQRPSMSFGANAGGGGVSFADVHKKLDAQKPGGDRVTVNSVLSAYPDAAVHRLSHHVPKDWSFDPELRPALDLLISRYLLACQKFGDGYGQKHFLARAQQLTLATGPVSAQAI